MHYIFKFIICFACKMYVKITIYHICTEVQYLSRCTFACLQLVPCNNRQISYLQVKSRHFFKTGLTLQAHGLARPPGILPDLLMDSLALDVLCAAEAISLFPLRERPGNDGCSPAERGGVEQRRGSNRITPPLTQGSCLSEMLSIRAHVSIMPATLSPYNCKSQTPGKAASVCHLIRQYVSLLERTHYDKISFIVNPEHYK